MSKGLCCKPYFLFLNYMQTFCHLRTSQRKQQILSGVRPYEADLGVLYYPQKTTYFILPVPNHYFTDAVAVRLGLQVVRWVKRSLYTQNSQCQICLLDSLSSLTQQTTGQIKSLLQLLFHATEFRTDKITLC